LRSDARICALAAGIAATGSAGNEKTPLSRGFSSASSQCAEAM